MTYTIAVCTVKISWWWTEELSETCRVSSQNVFEKLVHLVGFIIRKLIKMQSHMNVKYIFVHKILLWLIETYCVAIVAISLVLFLTSEPSPSLPVSKVTPDIVCANDASTWMVIINKECDEALSWPYYIRRIHDVSRCRYCIDNTTKAKRVRSFLHFWLNSVSSPPIKTAISILVVFFYVADELFV
jgi:hypothetical protein